MRTTTSAVLIALLLLLAGCGGSDPVQDDTSSTADDGGSVDDADDAGDGEDVTDTATADVTDETAEPSPAATAAEPSQDVAAGDAAQELPQFDSDFSRVCTTQVGFGGASPYVAEGGPSPVVLFAEGDDGDFIKASVELPAGWAIENDLDFEDNSELAPAELVACAAISKQTPNGVSCDLEGDDGSTTTLDLVDVTYTLSVYEAVSGELLGEEVIEAASTDCPFFVFIEEGQTEYLNTPDADAYTAALQPYVAP